MQRKRIVVMGFMGTCPIAGVVWQHIHYLVGLQRLGHDVHYIEDSARVAYNPETFEVGEDYAHAHRTLDRLARIHGFDGRWGFRARSLPDHPTGGLGSPAINRLYREADAILNICGAQELHEDLLPATDRLIYVESDPGVEQIKIDLGNADTIQYLGRHRHLFTFGENIGGPEFPVPLHGRTWLPTRQPVVTDLWRTDAAPSPQARFTTVANWSTSGNKDIEWRKQPYLWSKSLEFLKFIDAPRCSGEPFDIATDIKDLPTAQLFDRNGWHRILPHELSADFDAYRRFFQESKGEFTVAKDQYVRLNTGWFSDRTACYLAAGRPAITQETGFTRHYGGSGRGLFAFREMDEITEAVRAINADYAMHSRAAADLAREIFEAETVLRALLGRAGI